MSLQLLFKALLRRKVVTLLLLLQLALTLALLANSLLLASQTRDKLNEPTGLDLPHILQVQLKPTTKDLRAQPLLTDLLERQLAAVRTLSGVKAVAYANQGPILQGGNQGNLFDPDDPDRTNVPSIPAYYVSADFFAALGLKLLEGQLPQAPVAVDGRVRSPLVLTRSLAEKLFPNRSAVGLMTNHASVAAIVEDFYGHKMATDQWYNRIQVAPLLGVDWGYALLINTDTGATERIRQQLPDVLREVDANIEIFYVRSLQEQHQRLYRDEFGLATLLVILSGLMLLVAMVSSYSNAHFNALQQQQDIGIKRALGASKGMIFIELLCETWLTTALGALFGLVCAFALNQQLATVISMPPLQLWLPLYTTVVLMCCVTLATWYPARIATQVAPATATKTM